MSSKYWILAPLMALLLSNCDREMQWYTQQIPDIKPHVAPDFLPVSTWYSGGLARAPMLSELTPSSEADWRRDLQQIKALGFNTVRTWVEWAHCEPQPGQYRFHNLQLLARLANESGLRFIIQLYVDSAPDWVGKRFPNSLYEAQSGNKMKSQAAPGFCADHPGVRKAVTDFISRVAEVAIQYPNFHGWDLWSEPHIVNWAYMNYVPDPQFCYCENSCARFQAWLKHKYGTLEGLNKAWYRNFDNWSDVEPPRFGTILSYTDFLDWKAFTYQKMAEDLGTRYSAVRRVDKNHVITSHAAVPSVFYTPYNGYGPTDDFLMADQVDYYGTSLYPKHSHPARHWEPWRFMVAVDFSRSANRKNGGFYVGELQAGKGTIGLQVGDPITPADHRRWMWSVIAKGARAINIYAYYPMSSGYESGGYGLINLDGTLTERAVEAGRTARIITDNMELFLHSRPTPAEIALVYNPLAQMVGGEQRYYAGDMHTQSLFGYYRFFAENNIPVDFIHRTELENDDLSAYKLIIVPYPLMFTQTAADGLERYVRNGGRLIAEARAAWNDERGFAASDIPGMGLVKVFGARETQVRMQEKVTIIPAMTERCIWKGFEKENRLSGAYFAESLEVLPDSNTTVLAHFDDGSAAITVHPYGQGKAMLIGTFLGMASHTNPVPDNDRFMTNFLKFGRIERSFQTSLDGLREEPLEVRVHHINNGRLVFVINHASRERSVEIRLDLDDDHRYSGRDLVTGREQTVHGPTKTARLTTSIAAWDAQVWVLRRID